jgi:hypothetical protein
MCSNLDVSNNEISINRIMRTAMLTDRSVCASASRSAEAHPVSKLTWHHRRACQGRIRLLDGFSTQLYLYYQVIVERRVARPISFEAKGVSRKAVASSRILATPKTNKQVY